jgi:hypothetical protein
VFVAFSPLRSRDGRTTVGSGVPSNIRPKSIALFQFVSLRARVVDLLPLPFGLETRRCSAV